MFNKTQAVDTFDYGLNSQAARDRAQQFMGGKISRGIVELLTNSDTAYLRSKPDNKRLNIEIRLSRTQGDRWFEVRDMAGGMDRATVDAKFREGGATSDLDARGFFGLGAKDCAVFGALAMETVDSNRVLTRVRIPGTFTGATIQSYRAKDEDYQRLFGRAREAAGTVVRINVSDLEQGGPRMPQYDTLYDALRTHCALRALLQRDNVTLTEYSHGKKVSNRSKKLVYVGHPWETEDCQEVFNGNLSIGTGEDNLRRLRLFMLPHEIEGIASEESFQGHILIRSKFADYGITLAGFETQPHSRRLAGELVDDNIPTLLNQYRSEGQTAFNPRPVIKQDRDHRDGGLDRSHPYTEALYTGLREIIRKALDQLAAETREAERAGASEALNNANREAGRWLGAFLEGEGEESSNLPLGFYFLPPRKVMEPDTSAYVYLYYVGTDHLQQPAVSFSVQNTEACQVENDGGLLDEIESQNQNLVYRTRVKIHARHIGNASISASIGMVDATEMTIEVRQEKESTQEFRFERQWYSMQPSDRKTIRIVVPIDLAQDPPDTPVRLKIDSPQGTIVLVSPHSVSLDDCPLNRTGESWVVSFRIESRASGSASLTATYGDLTTTAHVHASGLGIPVVLDDQETSPPVDRALIRAQMCTWPDHYNALCLHVFVRHARIQHYIGEVFERADGSIGWSLVDSPGFRAMYAEAVADAAARHQVQRSFGVATASIEAEDLFHRFSEEKRRVLTQMQRVYIDDKTWEGQGPA